MFQPFERFTCEYLDRLIMLDKKFLVSQSYSRAVDVLERSGIDLLLSDYTDLGQAKMHYKAVIRDRYAAIIHLANETHTARLKEMLNERSGYTIFWNTVKSAAEIKRTIDQKYRSHIRRYLLNNTSWRIGSGQTVKALLEVTFGELFVIIKWSSQTLRIKFAEIENV